MKPIYNKLYKKIANLILLIVVCKCSFAQIPSNAVNADPSAKSISQYPLSPNILETAVLQFKFTNEATSANATGQIPANSVRITISFPGQFAYVSANAIPKFFVEDYELGAYGVVHLVNNQMIDEGEVVDLLLNVRGVTIGSGTVTFNVDRTTPVRVANTQTANDNASSSFLVTGTLPVSIEKFTAENQGCQAKISWSTNGERDIAFYELEMSNANDLIYQKIAVYPAQANSNGKANYFHNYLMKSNASILFRLKIVHQNGMVSYSPIARISGGCSGIKETMLLYPSPTKSTFTFNFSDASLINTKALVFNAQGKQVRAFILSQHSVLVNVSQLSPGMYFVKLKNGENVKFIKD